MHLELVLTASAYLLNCIFEKQAATIRKTVMTNHELARCYVFCSIFSRSLSLTQFVLNTLVDSITRIMHGYSNRVVHRDPLVISIWIIDFSAHRNIVNKKGDCVAASALPCQSRYRRDKRRKLLEMMRLGAFQCNNLTTFR